MCDMDFVNIELMVLIGLLAWHLSVTKKLGNDVVGLLDWMAGSVEKSLERNQHVVLIERRPRVSKR